MALENVDRVVARLQTTGFADTVQEVWRQGCTWAINPDLPNYFVDVYADPTAGFWHPNECLVLVSTEMRGDDPTLDVNNPICIVNWRWETTPGGLYFLRLRLAGNAGLGVQGLYCGFSLEVRRNK